MLYDFRFPLRTPRRRPTFTAAVVLTRGQRGRLGAFALGATRGRVVLIVQQGMTLVAFGIAIGPVVAYYATAGLATQVFAVTATARLTFAAATLLRASIALGASYLPSGPPPH
jgi:hypothetical protein